LFSTIILWFCLSTKKMPFSAISASSAVRCPCSSKTSLFEAILLSSSALVFAINYSTTQLFNCFSLRPLRLDVFVFGRKMSLPFNPSFCFSLGLPACSSGFPCLDIFESLNGHCFPSSSWTLLGPSALDFGRWTMVFSAILAS